MIPSMASRALPEFEIRFVAFCTDDRLEPGDGCVRRPSLSAAESPSIQQRNRTKAISLVAQSLKCHRCLREEKDNAELTQELAQERATHVAQQEHIRKLGAPGDQLQLATRGPMRGYAHLK